MKFFSVVYFIAFIPSAILAAPIISEEAHFQALKHDYQNLNLDELQEFINELNAMDEMNGSNSGLEKRLVSRKKGNYWTLMDTIAPMLKRSIESDSGLEKRLNSYKKDLGLKKSLDSVNQGNDCTSKNTVALDL
ncbi:hypothetical protein BB561_006253 [Smittium simulii]|uniref:Uncharacterized protein n=1 Tax=Smittium simulii TaxID=133385 RepID=A0A2T9Y5L7_9FUNG|nr:hypothetical protein BB561_006253 [Smittium simulii]